MEEIHYELFFRLKEAVEKRLDLEEDRPGVGDKTVYYIAKKLGEHIEISSAQLERIWYWKPTDAQPSLKMKADTLWILLEFIEFRNLKEFQENLVHQSPPEQNINLDMIIPEEIEEDKLITLGWYPEKYCKLQKGNHPYEFTVIESVGFKKKAGDIFYAPAFYLEVVKGQEYPDIIIDDGSGWFDEPE